MQLCKLGSRERHHRWRLAALHAWSARLSQTNSPPLVALLELLHIFALAFLTPTSVLSLMLFTMFRFPFQPLPHSLNHQRNPKFTSSTATLDYHPHALKYPCLWGDFAFAVAFATPVHAVPFNDPWAIFSCCTYDGLVSPDLPLQPHRPYPGTMKGKRLRTDCSECEK